VGSSRVCRSGSLGADLCLSHSAEVVEVEGRCAVIVVGGGGARTGTVADVGVDVNDDDFSSAVAVAVGAVVCDTFLCFPLWFLKGENRLWKGEERGDRGDLDSTGDTAGETVSAFGGSSLLRKAASDPNWDCVWA
jgi:hypothetical protein